MELLLEAEAIKDNSNGVPVSPLRSSWLANKAAFKISMVDDP